MSRGSPMPADVAAAVEGRAAVTPSLLWAELGGEGDFAPLWALDQLRRLGYGPLPAGFWWRSDLPAESAERLAVTFKRIEEAYPDERC